MNIQPFFSFLGPGAKRIAYWTLLGAVIATTVVLGGRSPEFGNAPINKAFQQLLDRPDGPADQTAAWSEKQKSLAKKWLGLDCFYAWAYSLFLALLCGALGRSSHGVLAAAGIWLSWAVLLGAVFDITENIALWSLLDDTTNNFSRDLARWMGKAKWIMPLLAVSYLVLWLESEVLGGKR